MLGKKYTPLVVTSYTLIQRYLKIPYSIILNKNMGPQEAPATFFTLSKALKKTRVISCQYILVFRVHVRYNMHNCGNNIMKQCNILAYI